MLADVHSELAQNSEYLNRKTVDALRNFAALTIIHVCDSDLAKKPSSDLLGLIDRIMNRMVVPTKSPFLILWRDFEPLKHENFLQHFKVTFSTNSNIKDDFIDIIPVSSEIYSQPDLLANL